MLWPLDIWNKREKSIIHAFNHDYSINKTHGLSIHYLANLIPCLSVEIGMKAI